MAGILNFSDENKAKIGLQTGNPHLNTKKGWLGGWFSSTSTSPKPIRVSEGGGPVSPVDVLEGKNFADLWIAFLLHEAENERNNTTQISVTKTEKNSTESQEENNNTPSNT